MKRQCTIFLPINKITQKELLAMSSLIHNSNYPFKRWRMRLGRHQGFCVSWDWSSNWAGSSTTRDMSIIRATATRLRGRGRLKAWRVWAGGARWRLRGTGTLVQSNCDDFSKKKKMWWDLGSLLLLCNSYTFVTPTHLLDHVKNMIVACLSWCYNVTICYASTCQLCWSPYWFYSPWLANCPFQFI